MDQCIAKIGATCIYNDHVFCTLLEYNDSLIYLFHNSAVRVMNARMSGYGLYALYLPERHEYVQCNADSPY